MPIDTGFGPVGALKNSNILLGISKSKHILRTIYMLRKDLSSLKLSPLADLEALHKQDVRIKAELSTTWLTIGGVPQNTWCPSKDWEIY